MELRVSKIFRVPMKWVCEVLLEPGPLFSNTQIPCVATHTVGLLAAWVFRKVEIPPTDPPKCIEVLIIRTTEKGPKGFKIQT